MKKLIRKLVLAMAVIAFASAWVAVAVVYFTTESITAFTIAVTIAALATEALFWILAIFGGWAVFANRKKLWNRFFGQQAG